MIRCSTCSALHSDGPDHTCPPLADWPEVRELVRQAVLAEREACAGILDRLGADWTFSQTERDIAYMARDLILVRPQP